MTKKTINKRLDRVLKPLGFQRKKATWNRRRGSLVDVVEVQLSKAGGSFTINVGVVDIDVFLTIWDDVSPEFFQAPHCAVEARIGQLIDNLDKWWQLDEPGVADDAAGVLSASAFQKSQLYDSIGEIGS